MSHDEIGGPVTRKERRKAFGGKRQAAPRYVFSATAHVRQDWGPEDLIENLEHRARGYNGLLRSLLCTTADTLHRNVVALEYHRIKEENAEAAVPVVSKRNQQPGRLSGSEREALKNFVAFALKATNSDVHKEEVTAMGRALLAKVRKRALGVNAVEVSDEDIVADMMDPEAQETAPGKDYEDTGTGDGA